MATTAFAGGSAGGGARARRASGRPLAAPSFSFGARGTATSVVRRARDGAARTLSFPPARAQRQGHAHAHAQVGRKRERPAGRAARGIFRGQRRRAAAEWHACPIGSFQEDETRIPTPRKSVDRVYVGPCCVLQEDETRIPTPRKSVDRENPSKRFARPRSRRARRSLPRARSTPPPPRASSRGASRPPTPRSF